MKTVAHKIVKTYYSLGYLPLSGLINDHVSPFKEVGQYYCVIETHTHTLHTNIYHTHICTTDTHIYTNNINTTHTYTHHTCTLHTRIYSKHNTHQHTTHTHTYTLVHVHTQDHLSQQQKEQHNFEKIVCAE